MQTSIHDPSHGNIPNGDISHPDMIHKGMVMSSGCGGNLQNMPQSHHEYNRKRTYHRDRALLEQSYYISGTMLCRFHAAIHDRRQALLDLQPFALLMQQSPSGDFAE